MIVDTKTDTSHSGKLAVVIHSISSEGTPIESLLNVSDANDKTRQGTAEDII